MCVIVFYTKIIARLIDRIDIFSNKRFWHFNGHLLTTAHVRCVTCISASRMQSRTKRSFLFKWYWRFQQLDWPRTLIIQLSDTRL